MSEVDSKNSATDDKTTTTMNEDGETVLRNLFESCASIQNRAKSWRTISKTSSTTFNEPKTRKRRRDPNKEVAGYGFSASQLDDTVLQEQELSRQLDAQILDYEAALQRLRLEKIGRDNTAEDTMEDATETPKKSQENDAADDTSLKKQIEELQVQINNEKMRKRIDELLVKRMEMSEPAVALFFDKQGKIKDDSSADDPESVLVKESIKCRDRLTTKALRTQNKIDNLKAQLRERADNIQEVHLMSRKALAQLRSIRAEKRKQQQQQEDEENAKGKLDQEARERMATETLILRRVLQEIIVSSASCLDWYGDERLYHTIQQLE